MVIAPRVVVNIRRESTGPRAAIPADHDHGYVVSGRDHQLELSYDPIGLLIDIGACIAIAMATGLVLRGGGRRLATTTARLLRGRSLTPPPRRDRE